ncbi:MAG: transposase [Nanoarchaeota archaeon]|nr:transposase [Nanoarchaeota archaeon]
MKGVNHNNYCVGQNCFHLVWKIKYAYSFLNRNSLKACVEGVIELISFQHNWEVYELQVMPDHVH